MKPALLLKPLNRLPVKIAAGLYTFYLLFGFFAVDPLAQKLLPWIGREQLASELSAQKVEFNPFTLEATVTGLKLAEKGGAVLAGFERLYVNLDVAGLARWAWRIRDIELVAPRATYAVDGTGRSNWQTLLDKLAEKPETPPSDTLPRVVVDHLRVARGNIAYSDAHRAGKPFQTALAPLDFELDGLSTLPEDRGDYTLAATLPHLGGTLKWRGNVALNPLASTGQLTLDGVGLSGLTRLVRGPRHFDVPSGTLGAALDYRFRMVSNAAGDDVPALTVSNGRVTVADFALGPKDGAPLAKLAKLALDGVNVDLQAQTVRAAKLTLDGLAVSATRNADGGLDWQTLFPPAPVVPVAANPDAPKIGPAPKPASAPWRVAVGAIRLGNSALQFEDRSFAQPLAVQAKGLTAGATLDAAFGDATALTVSDISVDLGDTTLNSGVRNLARLAGVTLEGGTYSLADARFAADALTVDGFRSAVLLDRQRRLNWAEAFRPAGKAVPQPAADAKAPGEATPAAKPFDLALKSVALTDIGLSVEDGGSVKPVRLDLAQGQIRVADVSLDLSRALPVEAGFIIRQGGRFSAKGAVVPGQSSGKLALQLKGLALKPFAAYVNQFALLELKSGAASTRGTLDFSPVRGTTRLSYRGGFAVDGLSILEEDTGAEFLGWRALKSDSLSVSLNPNRLHMDELVAEQAFGKVVIFEDKTVNLTRIVRQPAAAATGAKAAPAVAQAPAAKEAPAPKVASESAEPAFPVEIERVRIAQARAEFADLSLTPQFGTRMHDLSGVITGLSTDPKARARVELDGKVDEYGSARVRGAIQPFDATAFTDLALTFRNLEMANLTPYSGKFAGRTIESGKLSVDLQYKIDARQLAGENKFIVNKLKLGPHVDSPDAVNLPLDLAIALLEDSDGIIDLDLPISGSLDDPQFSYGKIVWKAITNVLTKLVTAPFRALGKLLGISSDQLEAVDFDPGSAALAPPELEKLKHVGEALAKRPALTLSVTPGVAADADGSALRQAKLRAEVATALGVKLAPGEAPGPIDVDNEKTRRVLETLYAKRFDKTGGTKALKEELAKAAPKDEDKAAATRRYADALRERLQAGESLDASALQALAAARGSAIRQALLDAGVAAERVAVGESGEAMAKDQAVSVKLSLGAK